MEAACVLGKVTHPSPSRSCFIRSNGGSLEPTWDACTAGHERYRGGVGKGSCGITALYLALSLTAGASSDGADGSSQLSHGWTI